MPHYGTACGARCIALPMADITSSAGVPPTGDLPPDALTTHGRTLLDWIAAYLQHPERYPVLARVLPGEIRAGLPAAPPAEAEPLERILADVESRLIPGITHWNHPGFFAYFSISASIPGILGELLTAALDVNGMLWKTSPAATELELLTMDWLRQMLGLGEGWFGHINDTASISTMLALAAAREAKPELQIRARGMAGRADLPVLRVYCSEHAHSSVDKGALALGFGLENVVKIPSDDAFRMRPELLAAAMHADRAAGMLPLACVATVGTTSAELLSEAKPTNLVPSGKNSAASRAASRARRVLPTPPVPVRVSSRA